MRLRPQVPTGGDIARALAEAFSSTPVDCFITSGHASERNWQIIFNQNKGSLVHTGDARLQFVESGGKVRHDVRKASVRAYLGAGNCLIGHIDSRACMATAWMHSAGVEQFAGYTVPSWYGFMGWGVSGLFGEGRDYGVPPWPKVAWSFEGRDSGWNQFLNLRCQPEASPARTSFLPTWYVKLVNGAGLKRLCCAPFCLLLLCDDL